jgi:hypothetical protein
MQHARRRATSKAVPIVVSAGLAVGVFFGLLFGVGKKPQAVAAAPAKGSAAEPTEERTPDPNAGLARPAATPTNETAPAAGSATAAAGSAVAATETAASAPGAAATLTEDKKIKLTVTIKPEAAAKDAKLIIDGKQVDGMTVELPAATKSVKVEVKAAGYRSVEKKIDLAGGDTAIELEMAKRPSSGTPGVRPPKRPDRPPGGGGLIDI